MVYTYQPNMDEAVSKPNGTQKGVSIVDAFSEPDIQQNFVAGRRMLNMGDIIDYPIRIVNYRIYEGENNFGKSGEFVTFEYYLDGDDANLHETTSQASGIKDRLRAIPLDYIQEHGGILAVIEKKNTPKGASYTFAGL